MPDKTMTQLSFGAPGYVDASLSDSAHGLIGSEILKIASEIRAMVAAGKPVCNLTVGDFNPKQFPIPPTQLDEIHKALDAGETNYPPSDGMLALRQAAADFTAREMGVKYPLESVLVASGSRPLLYGAYRCVVNPGDIVVYPAPSWNNNHYVGLTRALGVNLATRAEDGFQPTLAQIAPHLDGARMIVINTPLNPSGTVMGTENLREIVQAIVKENHKRDKVGRHHLFLLFDQVYGSLVFGTRHHDHPAALVPEAAPWVITVDGISKALAATGLRVGWLLAAPELTTRMRDLIGHVGAWAPRPEQVAMAALLDDDAAVTAYLGEMRSRVQQRLDRLAAGFAAMRADGYPVEAIAPQGAIYLSVRVAIPHQSNEATRQLLLTRAGLAVVPFQAFGLREDSGWFRISVGAVSLAEIDAAFPRLRAALPRR